MMIDVLTNNVSRSSLVFMCPLSSARLYPLSAFAKLTRSRMSSLTPRKPIDGRQGQKRWADSAQDKRIRNALKRQRTRRRDLSNHARQVACGTFETSQATTTTTTTTTNNNATTNNMHIEQSQLQPQSSMTTTTTMDIEQPTTFHPASGATTTTTTTSATTSATTGRPKKHKKKTRQRRTSSSESPQLRQHYANQLSQHEWMLSAPSDLSHRNVNPGSTDQVGWYVSPRPEGQRCLVTAHNGETVARDKNGAILGRFQSALPQGSRKRRGRTSSKKSNGYDNSSSFGNGYSILDCILQEIPIVVGGAIAGNGHNGGGGTFGLSAPSRPRMKRVYWVIDVMCWKGYSLYDCNIHFRSYWLQTKLSEEVEDQTNLWTVFQPVPRYECTTQGLQHAYQSSNTMKMDGLLFMHRNGHYDPGPLPTPLVLVWKDSTCGASHYTPSNTGGKDVGVLPDDIVILRVGPGTLLTQDHVQLGVVDLSVQTCDYGLNDLLRFKVQSVGIDGNGLPVLINPTYMGKCRKHRALAHSVSRILFHHGNSVVDIGTLASVTSRPVLMDMSQQASEGEEGEEENGMDMSQ